MTITERITALREQRARIDTEQRELLDTAASENRGLNTEERSKDDTLTQEFDSASDELRRLERQEARVEELRRAPEPVPAGGGNGPDSRERRLSPIEQRNRALAAEEYRDAFIDVIRGHEVDAEMRSVLAVGTDADGGYSVPETWRTDFIESLREESIVRSLANVITTAGGGDLHWPRLATDATAVTIVAESTTIPDDGPELDEVVLRAFKYAKIIKASDEFVQDTMIADLQAFIVGHLAMLIGQAQGKHFVIGTGSGQPQGLFTGAATGHTAALTTAITLDEALKVMYSVRSPYRRSGVFITADGTIAGLRALKDSTGQYLWQTSVQGDQPDRFLGKPIYAEPDVDALAANKAVLGFGDVKRAYTIRDAGGLAIKYLDQRYADVGQVAWRGQQRSDGKITDPLAFKVLKTAAS